MLIDILAAAGEAPPQNAFGFTEAMEQGGIIAWVILAVLVIMSVGSFYILITKLLEQYSSQFPSGFYMSLALGSMALSLYLRLKKREHDALFVGQWAPAFLLIGMYNKLVKLQGSD